MTKIRNNLRLIVIAIRHLIMVKMYKMDIAKSARISFGTRQD